MGRPILSYTDLQRQMWQASKNTYVCLHSFEPSKCAIK